MKFNISLVTRIGWALAIITAWALHGWNAEGSIIGVIVVVCGWTSIKIVNEGITATLLLARNNKDED